jgi:hypothetical protein
MPALTCPSTAGCAKGGASPPGKGGPPTAKVGKGRNSRDAPAAGSESEAVRRLA